VVRHAQVVPLDEDALAHREFGARALLHDAGELHARHEREPPGDAVARAGDHGVLEVDRRPLDADEDIADGEIVDGQLDDGRTDHLPRLRQYICREAHRLTVEAIDAQLRHAGLGRVRSHGGAHD